MKSCGCEYCNDLRHISPAKYIGVDNLPKYDDARIFIEDAANNKKFIWATFDENDDRIFVIVDKCPLCGYEFDEEDYDSY